ncbi:MAG: hypothetical protein ACI3VR_11825 [Intestinibacter sp.]|uniref:hypothetical protein n=1 Tax=Intestinibacter sp. TaxID=1965304 RepID=UPI003F17552D
MFKYTEYCTCFFTQKIKKGIVSNEVWIWDEIKDRRIQKIVVDGEAAALKIMKEWKENAPKNCICELI